MRTYVVHITNHAAHDLRVAAIVTLVCLVVILLIAVVVEIDRGLHRDNSTRAKQTIDDIHDATMRRMWSLTGRDRSRR